MQKSSFVSALKEAAPYINGFRGKVFVIGITGECLLHANLNQLAEDLYLLISLGIRVVFVHGARPQIDQQLQEYNLKPEFHHGLRITTKETMSVVKAAIGTIRHKIEAKLSMGMPNSPMHGAMLRVCSGNFITAKPIGIIQGIDMHYTGQIRRLDAAAIAQHLELGELVLLSPIGYSPTGESFNLCMEEVAYHAAKSLNAEKLIFLTQEIGVIDDQQVFRHALTTHEAETILQKSKQLNSEIKKLLPHAIKATLNGVNRSHLVNGLDGSALIAELFTKSGSGTMIIRAPLVKLRAANIDDVGDILALIRPLEEQGILVKRNRETLEMEINTFHVIEHDEKILGCASLSPYSQAKMAEIACLAIAPEHQGEGFAEMLLGHLEKLASHAQINQLFALTTRTAHWFIEKGFEEATLDQLPMDKQNLYNYKRRSKVFIKNLAKNIVKPQ